MPYIKQSERDHLDGLLEELFTLPDNSTTKGRETAAGRINYVITKILKFQLSVYGESYDHYNSLIGVLECAKLELYRRRVALYEDVKIKENGDVY